MKHHIELVVSIPVCRMGCIGIVKEEFVSCCYGEDYGEPCSAYSPRREEDGRRVIGGWCMCLDFIEKYIAFDCASYEYDEIDGFKSRGRFYDADNIQLLKIDGKVIEDTDTDTQE